jgi:hypothetical protein
VHVSNILAKLGVATGSRPPPSPAASAWGDAGQRRGLVDAGEATVAA